MAGIAYRYSGSVRSLTGAAYTNPTAGTYRLNVRTGSGSNDTMKFGLTTNTSASAYSPKLLINGNVCYIGRTEGGTASSSRSSSYVSEYRTATRKSTSQTYYNYAKTSISKSQINYYYAPLSQACKVLFESVSTKDSYDRVSYIVTGMTMSDPSAPTTGFFFTTTNSSFDSRNVMMSASFKGNIGNTTITTSTSLSFTHTSRPSGQGIQWFSRLSLSKSTLSQHYPLLYNNDEINLADICKAVECDRYADAVYYRSASFSFSFFGYRNTYYNTRSSRYTSATITATRSSSYTFNSTTHNYNI